MRERSCAINIRVTENEKRKMEKSARKCGLTLSAYLRKTGLGKEVTAACPPQIHEAYKQLKSLREHHGELSLNEVDAALDHIIKAVVSAYYPPATVDHWSL